ncbi:Tyrosine-protein phosphatase 1 [Cyphellophora attinorum]|uniref:Tyrosine-protein phosphatase 1 n=1 Tax=Cyphellophora attinorum TaxID=1664694 RepID=A0A0N0NL50_9EURO|nr:Tyrosine-protein phosphatase 1 [Phialophora attinorum]KPI38891.1 Tyrosine-protein phosphatase 1 [Phialophora attinorum]
MSTAQTATYSSSSSSHGHGHSHKKTSSRSSRPSTTPRLHPMAASVGQAHPPLLSPKGKSPYQKDPKSPSPSYFGFVVGNDDSIPPDSNPGHHARQNWNFPSSNAQSTSNNARHVPVESNPEFEAFRRQSEQGIFTLHTGSFSSLTNLASKPPQIRTLSSTVSGPQSPISPTTKRPHLDRGHQSAQSLAHKSTRNADSFFDFPQQGSPMSLTPRQSVSDEHRAPRMSLPLNDLQAPSLDLTKVRSDTLPPKAEDKPPSMVSPTAVADLLRQNQDVLILDLRVYQQYVTSRIKGALNLCIPTTLLKRPSFTTKKLLETFSSAADKARFEKWQQVEYILVYDASSSMSKEAVIPFNVLKKFAAEGWKGNGLVVKGGLQAFARVEPDFVERGPVSRPADHPNSPLTIAPPAHDKLPVAGGCAMPSTGSAANPFFGNIRQNMDLLDGVGQMAVQKPSHMTETAKNTMPAWLKDASRTSDEGKDVSDKFLKIERSEQKRMQTALNARVSYGTPGSETPNRVQVAGIEKGSKNRYNNIFPYDHSRVRLEGCTSTECDYINANHVKAEYSNRHYIATQAPIPATFNDFWRVVWEQDVRVIVMLTAENEGGQLKSHPYWKAGEYGALKVKLLSERTVSLDGDAPATPKTPGSSRPSLGMRRSTTNTIHKDSKDSKTTEKPAVVVRSFSLTHSSRPFENMRQVTQLHYSQWPDFGAPASLQRC